MNIPGIREFFKRNYSNILIFLLVLLLVFLGFGAGILTEAYLSRPPLIIEGPSLE